MPCQFGQISIDHLIFRAVGIGATHIEPGPIPDGLYNPDVVSAVVVPALALGDTVGYVGGFHVDGVSLAVGQGEVAGRANAN